MKEMFTLGSRRYFNWKFWGSSLFLQIPVVYSADRGRNKYSEYRFFVFFLQNTKSSIRVLQKLFTISSAYRVLGYGVPNTVKNGRNPAYQKEVGLVQGGGGGV